MKKLILLVTIFLTTLVGFSQAGDICFLHEATAANTTNNWSDIDHPALNNNPDAIIFVTHNMNGDGSFQHNDKVTGVFYNSSQNKWAVYNEDMSNLAVGTSYNIYVKGTEGKAITVTKPASSTFWFHVDNATLNNNSDAHPIITNNWQPNNVFNNNIYGWDYASGEWRLYNENQAVNIPTGASFNILTEPAFLSFESSLAFTHQALAGTIVNTDASQIDHPLLNNNPNACFVVTHSYDAPGITGSAMDVEHNLGVYYNDTYNKWQIVFEDGAAMQEDSAYNVVLPIPAPSNDEPGGAIQVSVLAVGSSCTSPTVMTNVGATSSSPISGDPSCGNYEGGDIWYYFVAPATGEIKIKRTNDGNWDFLKYAVMSSYTAEVTCGAITSAGSLESEVITGLTPGTTYGIRFWEWNNNDFGTEGFCVIAVDTSGISDTVIDGFSMYPNPVNDILNIETTNPVDAVSIYNMLGQEVINTSKTQIDMSALPAGSYVVKVQAGAQIGAYSLIKE